MIQATEQGASDTGPSLVPARRIKTNAAPTPPTLLWIISLLATALAVASSFHSIWILRLAARAYQMGAVWIEIVAALLAFASIAIVWPLAKGLLGCLSVRRANKREDLIGARVAAKSARDYCWITLGYSMGQLIVVIALQFLLANDRAVAKTFFLLPLMTSTFPLVLRAFWRNVQIFLMAESLVLVWGLVVALAMLAPGAAGKPLRLIATAYVDIFRSIPAVLVIYLVGFGIPLTGVPILKDLSTTTYVVMALTLTVGAYVAEIYRAGITSIHWSQTAGARSLGLSYGQTMRFVVIPQGVRNIAPPLLNASIAMQKDTALVSVVGVVDSFNQSMMLASNYFNLSAVTTVALLFVLVTIPQTRFVDRMLKRDRARIRAGGA
jgi:polar amino acid transport system permease protein